MSDVAERIIDLITKIEDEEIIIIQGKAYLIRPAEVVDI